MTARLRVLAISTLFPNAYKPTFGIFVERSLVALAAQPGIDLTVVAAIGMPPWPLSGLRRYAGLRGLPHAETWHGLTVLRPRFRLWPGFNAARNGAAVAKAVLRAVRDMPPFDVVDAHFFHPDGVAAAATGRALDLPYSITARGSDIVIWGARADTGPGIRAAAMGAGGILAVSGALRDIMAANGFPADRIHVHYTGVDAALFRPSDRAAARAELRLGDGPVLLSVGTLNANKGQHIVIDALPDLPNTTYLIAGAGPDAASLAAQAAALGVADRVQFLGPVAGADMPTLYNAADIMLLPSASEGLANAWVEAMACGTPVIAADIPQAREAVPDPAGGRIVQRNAGAIAEAVRALLAAPPDRAALSAATHAGFSWDRHGASRAAHLRKVAARR